MKRALRWFARVISLLFVFACLLPTELPKHYTYIEDSWIQVLHLAFIRHLQFGTDIIYTYGPWGFLYGGYNPETHLTTALAWLVLATVFWCAAWRVARLSFEKELAGCLWVMAIAGLTTVEVVLNLDARLLCWPLLLLLLYFFCEDRHLSATQVLLVVSLGWVSLIKFSVLVQSTVIVLMVATDMIWRRRRFPWIVLLFGGSVFFFWLIAGQRLSSFGPFIRNSLEITSGYTPTVMESSPGEVKYIGWFLALASASLSIAGFAAWKRLRFFGVLPMIALGFIVFSAFKYGFVRDDPHQAVGSLLLLLVSLACLAILWPMLRSRKWPSRLIASLPVLATFLFGMSSFHRFSQPPLARQMAASLAPDKWLGPVELLYNGQLFRDAWQKYLAGYREQFPLPPLKGDTDFYSWNQMELFAHGLPYRPRPVFQSYSAYTPYLAELNAAHLRGDHAAPTIVFDAGTIDNRYNSLEDGLSWPELLTRYDVQQVEFPFVVLTRSENPRKFQLTPLGERAVQFGESLSLPVNSNDIIWAEIEIDRTFAGSVVSALFKPPELYLKTTLGDGKARAHRFIPEISRAGFILSPFVKDCTSFATLSTSNWPSELMADAVTDFSIIPANGNGPPAGYRNSIKVQLYRLDFPRQNLDRAAGFHQVIELKEEIRGIKSLHNVKLNYLPGEGSVLAGAADSTILLERPKEATSIQVGFGLFSNETQGTNGASVQVSVLNGPGHRVLLWSRHLSPALTQSDRGKQEANIELGNSDNSMVLLETVPDGSTEQEALRPYWFKMHFK